MVVSARGRATGASSRLSSYGEDEFTAVAGNRAVYSHASQTVRAKQTPEMRGRTTVDQKARRARPGLSLMRGMGERTPVEGREQILTIGRRPENARGPSPPVRKTAGNPGIRKVRNPCELQ